MHRFLRLHSLAVLSTVASAHGGPQAAVIEFGCLVDGRLVFDTYRDSRKYANLAADARAALVAGWDDDVTLQYEGLADELTGRHRHAAVTAYIAQVPSAAKFVSDPGIAFFAVRPTWLRLTDLRVHPWDITEWHSTSDPEATLSPPAGNSGTSSWFREAPGSPAGLADRLP